MQFVVKQHHNDATYHHFDAPTKIKPPRCKQNHPDQNTQSPKKRPINPTTSPIKKESEKKREKKSNCKQADY